MADNRAPDHALEVELTDRSGGIDWRVTMWSFAFDDNYAYASRIANQLVEALPVFPEGCLQIQALFRCTRQYGCRKDYYVILNIQTDLTLFRRYIPEQITDTIPYDLCPWCRTLSGMQEGMWRPVEWNHL